MGRRKITFLLTLLMSMVSIQVTAHDIAVKNSNGVTIYYSLYNNDTELCVTFNDDDEEPDYNDYSGRVVIPESVVSNGRTYPVTCIDNLAFYQCSSLTSVIIPSTVTQICFGAFSGCSSLTSLTIPSSVTSIGDRVFVNCTSLTRMTVGRTTPPSIFSDNFYNCNTNHATLYVPAGSKDAYEASSVWNQFNTIEEFQTISFSDANVKALCVANWDMDGDNELSTVEAAEVTSLGSVFEGNHSITSFDELQYFTGLSSVVASAFSGCTSLTSVTIPNNVTSIGSSAFSRCRISSITIPYGVTSIGEYAFYGCTLLATVTIPNSVLTIGNCSFRDCSSLYSLTIPNSVTSIGEQAFDGCHLTSVRIPSSVTTIGSNAFYNCGYLTTVIVEKETPISIDQYTFSNRANATLYVPYGCAAAYNAAPYWTDFGNIVEMAAQTAGVLESTVLPWGTEKAWNMKYMFFDDISEQSVPPTDGEGHAWYATNFDDSSWGTLTGPIARNNGTFSTVNTLWENEGGCYYLRRTFNLDQVNGQGYTLFYRYDDYIRVWINGEEIISSVWDGSAPCRYIPASKFREGTNTLAIYLDDRGGYDAYLDYSMSKGTLYYLKNVETDKYLNAGNAWGTHAVLADEPLPVQINNQSDGSYTIFFPVGSQNQQLLFRDNEEEVYVDYQGQDYGCPYWTITEAGDGNYYIQTLTTHDTYGQTAMPGTYLGNNPNKEPNNDVDGNAEVGMNITWTLVPEGLHTAAQAARLQELITQAAGLGIDTSDAQAVLNDEEATYTEMLAQILLLEKKIADALYVPAGSETNPFTCAEANAFVAGLPADQKTEEEYYVKGKVSTIVNNFGYQYGNATFMISDDGSKNGEFNVFRTLYFDKQSYEGGRVPNLGDEVVLCGKLINYQGTSCETAKEDCRLVSLNSNTTGKPLAKDDLFSSLSQEGKDMFFVAGCMTEPGKPNTSTNMGCSVGYAVSGNPATYSGAPTAIDANYEGTVSLPEMADGLEVRTIAPSAFAGAKLTAVVVPAAVWDIETYAFSGCTQLASVTLPEGVILNPTAFMNCTALTSVVLPKGVQLYGGYSEYTIFSGCTNLTSITVNDETPYSLQGSYLVDDPSKVTLYVPYGCVGVYEAANYWTDFKDIVEMAPVIDENNRLYAADCTGRSGASMLVPVVLKTEQTYTAIQYQVKLPEGFTLSSASKAELLTANHTLEISKIGDQTWQVLVYTANRTDFNATEGTLMELTIAVDNSVAAGTYQMTLSDIVVSDADLNNMDLAQSRSQITIDNSTLIGDATNDGRVNVTDILAVANYILKIPMTNFNERAADVSGDGRINVTDIMGIANIILKVPNASRAGNVEGLEPQ